MLDETHFDDIPSLAAKPATAREAVADVAEPCDTVAAAVPNEDTSEHLPVRTISILSSNVVIKGEICADDEIVIHGTVEGAITHDMKKVVVGKGGCVRALIHANVVSVQGEVDGDIHGNEFVELLDGARVEGDIFCPSIRMEKGARFNGTINMPLETLQQITQA